MPNVLMFAGAETGDLLETSGSSGSVAASSAQKHSGLWSYHVTGDGSSINYFLLGDNGANGAENVSYSAAPIDLYVSFWFYVTTAPSSGAENFFIIRDSSAKSKAEFRLNSDRKVDLYRANGLTLLASGTTVLNLNTWYFIEAHVGTDSGSGDGPYELKINGVSEYSGTAATGTDPCWTTYWGNFVRRSTSAFDFYFDDIGVTDDAYLGPVSIARLDPTEDGTYSAWTGTYEDVDDLETSQPNDGDGTYIYTSTFNKKETDYLEYPSVIGLTDLDTIYSLRCFTIVRESSGTASSLRVLNCQSGTTDYTTSSNPGSSYIMRSKLYNDGFAFGWPSGNWLASEIEDLEVGVWFTPTATATFRCTALGGMVLFASALPGIVSGDTYTPHAGI